jgi:hypothetical protein
MPFSSGIDAQFVGIVAHFVGIVAHFSGIVAAFFGRSRRIAVSRAEGSMP